MTDDGSGWLRAGSTDADDVAKVYDGWAASYDADLRAWRYQAPLLTVAALVAAQPNAAPLLDVGCGTGLVGRELRAAGYGRIVGIDLSARSLELAEATGAYHRLERVDLQAEAIPFPDASFAAVVCVGVMTYLPDTTAMVSEFCRVTERGGSVLFTQRDDLWGPRGCLADLEALTEVGRCRIESISEPLPYLPASDELGDVPIRLVHLRAEARS